MHLDRYQRGHSLPKKLIATQTSCKTVGEEFYWANVNVIQLHTASRQHTH